MFRIIAVCAFLSFSSLLLGQNQPNPFDLKFRPANPKPATEAPKTLPKIDTISREDVTRPDPDTLPTLEEGITIDTTRSDNPFELKKDSKDSATTQLNTESTIDIGTKAPIELAVERKIPSRGIQIFFLLFSLLLLIFIVNVERSFVRDLWKVISNENYSSLHLRNQRNTMRKILLLMGYMIFIIQAGLFLFHTIRLFGYKGNLFDNVWTCMSFILLVYLVRHTVISYLRWLFNNDKEMALFNFDISIFNIMVGLVLLPINVIINFGPENLVKPLIITGLIIAVAAYLMRQLRWMFTARQLIADSLFLFFIYLCAIEILPLWAISKLFW